MITHRFRKAGARVAALATLAALAHTNGALLAQRDTPHSFKFQVTDVDYQRNGGTVRVARLYQPSGAGPFPAVLQVHGGAWNTKDRRDGEQTALELVSSGIVVLSIEFRNAPEAPYPASLQDINYGIRWLKAHSREFGSSPERVGLYGTSSGGHQVLLAAIRPDDPRYRALPLAESPQMQASVAFVVSGWGVLFPPGGAIDLQLLEGERHTFVTERPFAPNSVKAIEMVKAFIKKHGSAQTTPR